MSSGPRVGLVEPGSRPELAETEARILAERGRVSLLYQVLLNSGPIASGWERLLTAVRNQTGVPADLRELMILRVAVLNRAAFEFDAHPLRLGLARGTRRRSRRRAGRIRVGTDAGVNRQRAASAIGG